MNADAVDANLRGAILEAYSDFIGAKSRAEEGMVDCIASACRCGEFILEARQIHKGHFLRWFRDNFPQIPVEMVATLLKIRERARTRSDLIDRGQLVLVGLLQAPEEQTEPQRRGIGPPKWIGYAAKLREDFNRAAADRPISQWSPNERQQAIQILRPVLEILEELGVA